MDGVGCGRCRVLDGIGDSPLSSNESSSGSLTLSKGSDASDASDGERTNNDTKGESTFFDYDDGSLR